MKIRARNVVLGYCFLTTIAMGCARDPRPDVALDSHQNGSGNDGKGNVIDSYTKPELDENVSSIRPVYFDYDSYGLRHDALQTLKSNADVFSTTVPTHYIQIAGHCDARGTQEYNLALGEQRALAVRHHLENLGIDRERLQTISYGEELPAELGDTEASYALNRRCEFKVTAR